MDFTSTTYLAFFLPGAVLGHWVLRRFINAAVAQAWLLVASATFYALGAATPLHVALLVGSILFNWSISRKIASYEEFPQRLPWLYVGLGGNIVFLGVFKYTAFFLSGIYGLFGIAAPVPHLIFPLGISFYTLTSVMYLVDCYQKLNEPLRLFDYASSVPFFPYITSGPIVRAATIAPQFRAPLSAEERATLFTKGIYRMASGLGKKLVLADLFASVANAGFASTQGLSSSDAWIASVAYTLQMYFDFSGYSDIAIGSAALLGIRIPENFNWPYISQSMSEFWTRWHMSLSHFITNYLYTPIVRSFGKATLRTSAIATILAMTIAGLWHGPAMTYVVWGVMHGIALAINQVWKRRKLKLPKGFGWFLTMMFVNVSLVVFRAPDLGTAAHVLRMMFVPFGVNASGNLVGAQLGQFFTSDVMVRACVIGLPIFAVFLWRLRWSEPTKTTSLGLAPTVCAVLYSLLVYCVLFAGATAAGFIYTQF